MADDIENEDEWVEVASVGDDEEAEIIAGLLESEDIPCEIEGPSATPWPENTGAMGLSRVVVPADGPAERERDADRNLSENTDE